MINFYDLSIVESKKKGLKKYRVIFYIALSLLILLEVLSCFLIEYKNKNIMQPVMIGVGILSSIFLVYFYLYFIYPNKWIINRYTFINNSFKHQLVGVVESIKENVTLRRNIVGKEITFLVDKESVVLFLEDNESSFEFCIGKKYSVQTYDNFIVTAEEIIDE